MEKILLCLLLTAGVPCLAQRDNERQSADKAEVSVNDALLQQDFGKAIEIAWPKAQSGDPEHQFGVGYLMLLWLDAPTPKAPPRYSLQEATAWIRKAAAQDLPQAAGFLRSGYEWGRYGLPKNPELEACWRKVESAEQRAAACIAKEQNPQISR